MKPPTTDTLFTAIAGGSVSTIVYLIGGVDNLVNAVAIFMFIDILMGLTSSYYTSAVIDSTKAYRGVMKKSGMIAFVILANQLDIITGNPDGFLRDAMLMIVIGLEGISIIENIRKMGVEPPAILKDALYKLAGKDPNDPNDPNDKTKGA